MAQHDFSLFGDAHVRRYEETGGKGGAGWLVQHRPELLRNAEYLLTEGDHIHAREDGRRVVQVAVGEKTPCWIELTASGETGHGSTPRQCRRKPSALQLPSSSWCAASQASPRPTALSVVPPPPWRRRASPLPVPRVEKPRTTPFPEPGKGGG